VPGELPQVRIEFSKWGGRPHYCLSMGRLGEDEFGVWLWAPAGNVITKGDDSFLTQQPTLGLVPRSGMWNAAWWLGHPELELYLDINTPPEWAGEDSGGSGGSAGAERVSMVDLDLDVIRWLDGCVAIVDEDEFAAHRVEYGYPPDVVDAALNAAAELQAAVEARREPFGDVMERWLPCPR
jgi:hypothetical protein